MTDRTLVLRSGVVRTMDPVRPVAAAVAVADGRIVAVGSDDEVTRVAGPRADVLELRGRAVVPGWNDAHLHLLLFGESRFAVALDGVTSIAEAVARTRTAATAAPSGAWVLGVGWRRDELAEGRLPTAADLDHALPGRPVVLHSRDLHSAWCSTAALRAAGIDAHTPDPDGGRIARDAHGEPTGVLFEGAVPRVLRALPPTGEAGADAALDAALRVLAAEGVTSVTNMEGAAALSAVLRARAAGRLTARVCHSIPTDSLDAALALGLRAGLGDEWVRIGPLKVFADGSLGSRTAWMLAPYEGTSDSGIAIHAPGALEALLARAGRAGIAPAVHAIGDRAVREVLDVLAAGRRDGWLAGLRPRLEHAQLIAPEDISRLGALGVIASVQPQHATSDLALADAAWGARARTAYAWRALADAGAVLAFGSDAPVEPPSPRAGLHAAVTRRRPDGTPTGGWYPEQCVTVDEALRAYACGGAYATGEERAKGVLVPGALGDLVVLADDPMTVAPDALRTLGVELTVVGGRVVHAVDERERVT